MKGQTRNWVSGCAALVVVLGGGTSIASGQGGLSTYVTGVVTDPTKGPVPGAQIQLKNEGTGGTSQVSTNAAGLYRSANLLPGSYQVEVSLTGFRTVIQKVSLELGQALRLDFALEVGSVQERVEVTAAAPVLNTENAELGQIVPASVVASLPFLDRRSSALLEFTPAANFTNVDNGSYGAPRFNLGGTSTALFMVGPATASGNRMNSPQLSYTPPLGAIQEVKVIESGYGAEQGGTQGALIAMEPKSGTNKFHGEAYEMLRNEFFDARFHWASVKGVDRWHDFGGSLGGPMVKNRSFFYFTAEGVRSDTPNFTVLTIPTPQMVGGDFSKFVDARGELIPIYDPATTRADPSNPSRLLRDPFPGNIIRSNRIDPVAAKALAFYPAPNLPGTIGGANNWASPWSLSDRRHSIGLKVDHRLSGKDQISGQWMRDGLGEPIGSLQGWNPAAQFGNGANGATNHYRNDIYSLSYIRTFSPTIVNQLSVTYRPRYFSNIWLSYDPASRWAEQLGVKNVYSQNNFPMFSSSGYVPLGNTGGGYDGPIRPGEASNTVTVVKGKHTWKFGAQIYRETSGGSSHSFESGQVSFDQRFTALPGGAGGNSIASFLLGQVSNGALTAAASHLHTGWYVGSFVQDDWKVTRKLMISLGLRWDIDTATGEVRNQGNGFDPHAINPVSGTPGVVTFLGVTMPDTFTDTQMDRFQPRVGFAYQVASKTTVRGSYGVHSAWSAFGQYPPLLGFNPLQVSWSTTDNGITPAFLLQNGFPAWKSATAADRTPGYGAVPVGSSPTTSVSFVDYNRHIGYVQRFNVSIQRELLHQTLLEVAANGALGRKIAANRDLNQVPPQLALPGNAQTRRPFPQFANVTQLLDSYGNTNYYALTIRVEKQATQGLTVLGNYAWVKQVGITGCDDSYNCRLNRGVVSTPLSTSRVAAIYDVPVGRGKQFLATGVAGRVLGDWKISGLLSLRSGYPFGLGSGRDSQNRFSGIGGRLNLIDDLQVAEQTLQKWFNTAAVTPPPFGQIGNLGPNPLRGPSLYNLDMSLLKTFRIREQLGCQLRADVFNLMNHMNYGLPGTTFGTPTFGVITGGAATSQYSGSAPAREMQIGVKITF